MYSIPTRVYGKRLLNGLLAVTLVAIASAPGSSSPAFSATTPISTANRGGFGHLGCVAVTVTLPASEAQPVREFAIEVAKTKSTDVAEKIVRGDPLGANYEGDWMVGGPLVLVATSIDASGVQFWYLTGDLGEARTEPITVNYEYCGVKNVVVQNGVVLTGPGDDGDPLTGPYYSPLDAHVPSD